MNTLTLFRAYVQIQDQITFLNYKLVTREAEATVEKAEIREEIYRKCRQKETFCKALTKRLQEQEEELAELRKFREDVEKYDTYLKYST